jgi:uncharacterized damage-inducible protein DinB
MKAVAMNNLIPTVRAVLSVTPARWTGLAAALPEDLLNRPPAPGEWSALHCLHHILAVESVFLARARSLLVGQDFDAYDPDAAGATQSGGDPTAVAAAFAAKRAETLVALAQVREADLGRIARHAELGPVTLGELLHEWAAHDLMHTVQGERALMQPFIAGCGAWQSYFTAHAVGA